MCECVRCRGWVRDFEARRGLYGLYVVRVVVVLVVVSIRDRMVLSVDGAWAMLLRS